MYTSHMSWYNTANNIHVHVYVLYIIHVLFYFRSCITVQCSLWYVSWECVAWHSMYFCLTNASSIVNCQTQYLYAIHLQYSIVLSVPATYNHQDTFHLHMFQCAIHVQCKTWHVQCTQYTATIYMYLHVYMSIIKH